MWTRTPEHCRLCKNRRTDLSLYLKKSNERLLRPSKSEKSLPEYERPVSTAKNSKDCSNEKRNNSMVNFYKKQQKIEVKRHRDGLEKII